MTQTRDWRQMKDFYARLLEQRTGEDMATWNERISHEPFENETSLRNWLAERGVTGYPQALLVMEKFGYPDFMQTSADELVNAQYTDRQALRPIYEAVIDAAERLGEVVIQTRKTYVSLVTPRRTFARVQATTHERVDLGLRLEGVEAGGRLVPSKIHETMTLQISLTSPEEVNEEVLGWLEKAYDQNS